MNKCLSLLIVALMATMSFALTACGDDEPKDYTLTINGKGVQAHTAKEEMPEFSIFGTRCWFDADLYPAKSSHSDVLPSARIALKGECKSVKTGGEITLNDGYVEMLSEGADGVKYTQVKSGKVSVEHLYDFTIMLRFDNLQLANEKGKTVTLDGTLKFHYGVLY